MIKVLNGKIKLTLGCISSYDAECPGYPDVFVCPAKACENDTIFFQCKDRKYCIVVSLVCDGYAQCEDGSGKKEVI